MALVTDAALGPMGIEELDRMPDRVRERYLEIQRAIAPGRKLEITAEFCDATRDLVIASIRSEMPGADEDSIRREFIIRSVGPEIAKRVYGW